MGGLVINPEIRCLACFHIYSIQISPNFPKCLLLETCKCGTKSVDLSVFLPEYRKNKKLIIYCFKCDKKNIKDASYCVECKKLYCSKCLKNEHLIQNPNNIHRYIPIDKYDFFCINHQTENFCAYCKTCKEDICNMCVQNKLHDGHNVLFYNKMYNEKKMEEFYKKGVKLSQSKIEHNRSVSNTIFKKFKKNEVKDKRNLIDLNEFHNKFILEAIGIFHEMYGTCKNKNYALISNLLDNLNFNFEKIKFEKGTTKEKDLYDLLNYLRNDYIIKIKPKEDENKQEEKKKEKKFMPIIACEGRENANIPQENEDKKENVEKKENNEKKENEEKKENDETKENEKTKENQENVVTIVQSQIINSKKKKKPRKVNFDL